MSLVGCQTYAKIENPPSIPARPSSPFACHFGPGAHRTGKLFGHYVNLVKAMWTWTWTWTDTTEKAKP